MSSSEWCEVNCGSPLPQVELNVFSWCLVEIRISLEMKPEGLIHFCQTESPAPISLATY